MVLLFGFFQIASAVNVEGKVIDKDTNLPIVDAVILALSNNVVLASANSNINGDFKIALKKGKTIRLEVVKNGYKTENADVEIDQAFIDAEPFITIKLQARKIDIENIDTRIDNNPDQMENVGNLSELPEGYKIIEAVPIKDREDKKTGFNVRPEVKDQTTNVNVDVLKTEYNKALENTANDPNHNFTTSYYKEGSIFYNVGKAFLTPEVKEILKGIALRLKNDPETSLRLTVFSDANKELNIVDFICKMRLEEIVNLLMNEGVKFEQLDVLIYGHQLLKNNCNEGVECTEEQHQENRRVELTFLK